MANFFARLKRRHIHRLAAEPKAARRLAAIFAADVAGYSRLMGQDEAGTVRALSAARTTMDRLITQHGGRIVNTAGDSVLAEFPSVVDAVKCAIAVQEQLLGTEAGAAERSRLLFRIAVHVGDVLPRGADIFGDGINVCARLQEIAEPGGICVSGAAYQYVRKLLPVTFDDLGEKTLKNIDEPVRVLAFRASEVAALSSLLSKRSATSDLAVARSQADARRLGWLAAGGLVAVMAIVLIYQFVTPTGTTTIRQTGIEAAKAAASSPASAISIAVLPFANMSGDAGQEFFSDGMTEEITSALARVPDLRVVGRTSAFQFKGYNQDLRTIGQSLAATHLIEGSVRKAGNRVRITVQLINAHDGTHVWTEDYDRELTDIFALQEDIARAIATSLRMPLGLKPGENLVVKRMADPALHEKYLHAKNLVRTRNAKSVAEAIKLLDEVVARAPDFAPAWGLLGTAYFFHLLFNPAVASGTVEEALPIVRDDFAKGKAAAERAVKLDPKSADGYLALAQVGRDAADYLSRMDLYRQALALDPDHPEALHSYSANLATNGFVKEAIPIRDHLLAVEPFVPAFQNVTARFLFATGQDDAALAILNTQRPSPLVAQIYAAEGRYNEAADILEGLPTDDPARAFLTATAAKLLRAAPATAPKDSPDLDNLDWIYVHTGMPERLIEFYERGVRIGYQSSVLDGSQWAPAYSDIRKTARFKIYLRDSGILAYWRAKGWPDVCHPTTGDDFDCE